MLTLLFRVLWFQFLSESQIHHIIFQLIFSFQSQVLPFFFFLWWICITIYCYYWEHYGDYTLEFIPSFSLNMLSQPQWFYAFMLCPLPGMLYLHLLLGEIPLIYQWHSFCGIGRGFARFSSIIWLSHLLLVLAQEIVCILLIKWTVVVVCLLRM